MAIRQATLDSIRALMLIRAYRVRGHLYADLDPLGPHKPIHHPELDYETYGFTDAYPHRPNFLAGVIGLEMAGLRRINPPPHVTYRGPSGPRFPPHPHPVHK